MIPKVKICCIQDIEEANLAIGMGASAIGLVSEMPSGPGVISEAKILGIAESVSKSVHTFLLTSKQNTREIIDQLIRCGTDTVQIVDSLTAGVHDDIKEAIPEVTITQVVHVTGEESLKEAECLAPHVDMLLLDSGNPFLQRKELGGTGRTHDWEISRKIRRNVDIPVFVAGGLDPQNVYRAVKTVNPYGVDVCTGVRTGGKLDKNKLSCFMDNLHSI